MNPFTFILSFLSVLTIVFGTVIPSTSSTLEDDYGMHMMCAEGIVQCMGADDKGYDGGVFQCVKSFWRLIANCRSNERCIKDPIPHCAWQSPSSKGEVLDVVN